MNNEFDFDCPSFFLDLSLFINKRKQSFSFDDIDEKINSNNDNNDFVQIDEWFFIKHPLHERDVNIKNQANETTSSSIKLSKPIREKGKILSNHFSKPKDIDGKKGHLIASNTSEKTLKKGALPSRIISKTISSNKSISNTASITNNNNNKNNRKSAGLSNFLPVDKFIKIEGIYIEKKEDIIDLGSGVEKKDIIDNSSITMEEKLREFKSSQQQKQEKNEQIVFTNLPVKGSNKRSSYIDDIKDSPVLPTSNSPTSNSPPKRSKLSNESIIIAKTTVPINMSNTTTIDNNNNRTTRSGLVAPVPVRSAPMRDVTVSKPVSKAVSTNKHGKNPYNDINNNNNNNNIKIAESKDDDQTTTLELLKQHNKRFAPVAAYEPPRHSVRDVRKWEKQTNQSWSSLKPEERELANSEITKLKGSW